MEPLQILNGLLTQPTFYRRVIAHMDEDYFDDPSHRLIVEKIKSYSAEFRKQAQPADIRIMIQNDMDLTEKETQSGIEAVSNAKNLEQVDDDLLFKETEQFAKDMAFENVLRKSVTLMTEGEKKDFTKGMLPEQFRKALSVSFTTTLGHDYFRDAPSRYEFYTNEEELIKLDVESINQALGDGLRRKALYVPIGRTNIGKTLWTCHWACALAANGYNVLYISGEMAEEMIAQRLDANILDMPMDDLGMDLDRKSYLKKVRAAYENTTGRLKIKEYSAGACNALHIQNLLNEYKLKDDFVPDVIICDYLNLFASFRLPAAAMSNTYLYTKSVAEELRGLGRENNCAIVAPTQTNRSGASAGESTDMGDTADSFGLPMTADWMGAIIQNEELFELGKYLLKTLKSRFGDNINTIYTVGVTRSHMRLYELPEEQHEIPQHMKDMLAVQAASQKANKDKDAMNDLAMSMNFEEEEKPKFNPDDDIPF